MAITAKVVSNTLATTGSTAFTSSGFGTPDAAIIFVSRGNTTDNPATHAQISAGFWCADPAQAGVAFAAQDAVGTSNTGRYGGDVNAIPVLSTDVASLAVQYSAASTTDGINLSVAAGSTTVSRYASVLLLKGVTNTHVGAINLGTGTSAINVTAPGFRADLVLFLGAWVGDETRSSSARFTFGAAKIDGADTVTQGCVVLESRDNAAATDTSTAIHADAAAAKILSTVLDIEITVGAHASGFTVTPSGSAASNFLYYLALELPSPDDSYVGVVETATGTGDTAYNVTAFEPIALLLAGTMCTATGTLTETGSMHLGMGGPASAEWCTTFIDEDASDPTDNESYADTSNILRIQSAVGSTDTIASLVSLDADGWTLNYSDGSASARKMLAIAIGNSSAGGVQTLTPSLVTNTQTFHAATVIRGAVTLTPSLVTNSQTFHAATVSTGSVTLSPSLVTNGQTFHAPTVTAGAVTLAPSLVTNNQTFHAETVTVGTVNLTPSLVTNGQTFYAPVVANGGVTLAPSLVTNSQTFPSPTISVGAVTLTLDVVVNGQTFYAPTVAQPSGQTLEPTLVTNGQTFYGPTVEGMLLTQADLDAISAAVWADPAAVAAHAKLDEIIARITC